MSHARDIYHGALVGGGQPQPRLANFTLMLNIDKRAIYYEPELHKSRAPTNTLSARTIFIL